MGAEGIILYIPGKVKRLRQATVVCRAILDGFMSAH